MLQVAGITPAMGGATAAAGGGVKLELAKKLASRIHLQRNLGSEHKGATQQAAEAILKGASQTHTYITVRIHFNIKRSNNSLFKNLFILFWCRLKQLLSSWLQN